MEIASKQSIVSNLSRAGGATGRTIERYLQVIDRKVRLAAMIGLQRESRRLPHPLEYIQRKVDA